METNIQRFTFTFIRHHRRRRRRQRQLYVCALPIRGGRARVKIDDVT